MQSKEASAVEQAAQQLRYGMWRAVPTEVAQEAGISVCRFGPVQATVVQGLPEDRCLNRVQGSAEPGAISGGHLANAIDWMDSQGVEYSVPVTEGRPGAIKAVAFLGNRGFAHNCFSRTYIRGILPPRRPAVPNIRIHPLGDRESDGFGVCQIADDVFGLSAAAWALVFPLPTLDGWRCYTASTRDEGQTIAACGAMYMHDGIARFGIDATVESARCRGLNQALLHRRLLDAPDGGCQVAVAEAPDGDEDEFAISRNLTSLGFQRALRTQYWARPVSPSNDGGPEAAFWLGV